MSPGIRAADRPIRRPGPRRRPACLPRQSHPRRSRDRESPQEPSYRLAVDPSSPSPCGCYVCCPSRPVARSFGSGWAYPCGPCPAPFVLRRFRSGSGPLSPPVDFSSRRRRKWSHPAAESDPGVGALHACMWAGGSVIFLFFQWLGYRAFLGQIRDSSRPARPPLFGGIRTWISDKVDGPLALGVIERRIVLPGDFSRRYNPVERRLALEHELVHHRRGDIWWNGATSFSPFSGQPRRLAGLQSLPQRSGAGCDARSPSPRRS